MLDALQTLPVDFDSPRLLFLLPLALLPWLKRERDSLEIAAVDWLPRDVPGQVADRVWRLLAMATIASVVFAMAKPGSPETRIERIGRGAELSIVMDRSSSMDATAHYNKPPEAGLAPRVPQPKNTIVRTALSGLLQQRPDNRYALTLFNAAVLRVSPFTNDVAVIQAGLDASSIGRGSNETNMGLALLAATDVFEGRSYSGSRAILLVSDGGAKLTKTIRKEIQQGLERNRVALYFIYIQSSENSPNLETVGREADKSVDEIALHLFFKGLGIDYHVYQADDPESMAAAIKQIDEQQNLPLTYFEKVPRIDYMLRCLVAALLFCILLMVMSTLRMERWV
ncbi:MAG: VWA domain-containing protein [Granulosicoccus sp.]